MAQAGTRVMSEGPETTSSGIPADTDAVSVLLSMARAFFPDFNPAKPAEAGQPARSNPNAISHMAEARFRTLVEQLPAATFMTSFENGRSEIYVSSHIETLLGYSATEWIENPILWYQRLHPSDKDRWNKEFSRTVSWAEPFKGEYRFLAKDGRVVWIHGEVKLVRDESGRPSFLQGIGYDITELKRIEEELRQARDEAERASQAKSEFLSRMSHELRTPLHSILGYAQLLEMDARNAEEAKSVSQILKAGNHLLALINEVLDISRIEADDLTVAIEPVLVSDIVRDALGFVRQLANDRNVQLGDLICDRCVLADKQRLKQVLLNLLSNAIKYNRDGGSVTLKAEPTSRGTLRLSVRDTGPGIPPDDLRKLFTPFERLRADHQKIDAIGLGLAISKRLVELMDGQIGVESVVDEGSIFWLELPLTPLGRNDQEYII